MSKVTITIEDGNERNRCNVSVAFEPPLEDDKVPETAATALASAMLGVAEALDRGGDDAP